MKTMLLLSLYCHKYFLCKRAIEALYCISFSRSTPTRSRSCSLCPTPSWPRPSTWRWRWHSTGEPLNPLCCIAKQFSGKVVTREKSSWFHVFFPTRWKNPKGRTCAKKKSHFLLVIRKSGRRPCFSALSLAGSDNPIHLTSGPLVTAVHARQRGSTAL